MSLKQALKAAQEEVVELQRLVDIQDSMIVPAEKFANISDDGLLVFDMGYQSIEMDGTLLKINALDGADRVHTGCTGVYEFYDLEIDWDYEYHDYRLRSNDIVYFEDLKACGVMSGDNSLYLIDDTEGYGVASIRYTHVSTIKGRIYLMRKVSTENK